MKITCSATLALSILAFSFSPARGQFEELASRVPQTANAIALFNVERIAAADHSLHQELKREYQESFRAGRVFLPPGASRCLAAAQLDLDSLQPVWELTLVDYSREPDLTQIARQNETPIESIAGAPSVAVRSDIYLVQLGPARLALLSPPSRQEVSRWIKGTANKTHSQLSPYLLSAVNHQEQDADIVLAIDLEDAISPERIRQTLSESPALRGSGLDLDRATGMLSDIRGLILRIRAGSETHGDLQIDFRRNVSSSDQLAKPLLLELLAKTGAMVADLNNWKVAVKSERITLDGSLSQSGLRRVTSLVEPRTIEAKDGVPSAGSAPTAAEAKVGNKTAAGSEQALATQQYFRSIQALLNDLDADVEKSVTIGQSGVWMQKYSGRIDRLPVLHVDPDALNYGAYVSEQLLAASGAVKGIGIESGKRRSAVWDSGYRYYDQFVADAARRQVTAEARAAGATSATEIMREIYKASGDVRRTLSQRYMLEF